YSSLPPFPTRRSSDLESGGFKVPYLNTDFEIEAKTDIHVTKNRFEVANATITDTKYGTTASLNGYGGHNNFQDWELNLKINAPRSEEHTSELQSRENL